MVFSTLKIRFNYDCKEYVTTINRSDITGDECDWWDYWFNEGFYTFQVAGDMFEDKVPTDNNLRVFVYALGDYEDDDRIAEIKDIDIIKPEWKKFKEVVAGDSIFVTNGFDTFKLNVESVDKYGSLILQKNDELSECQYLFDVPNCIEDDEDKHDSSILYHSVNGILDYVIISDKYRCLSYLEDLRNRINKTIDTMSKPRYKWELTSSLNIDGISYCSGEFLDKECCYEDMRKNAMELFDQFSSEQMKENKFVTIKFKESAIWFDLGYDYRFTYNIIEC